MTSLFYSSTEFVRPVVPTSVVLLPGSAATLLIYALANQIIVSMWGNDITV